MKIREQKKSDFHNSFFKKGLQIGVLSVGILPVFTILIGNAADLRIALNQSTQKYLDDVTVQTAHDILDVLTNKMTSLVTISDTASHLDEECIEEEQLVEFLHRKAQILEFDPMILLHRDGTIISSDVDSAPPWIASADFFQIDGVLASFEGEVKANYIGGQSIFYSVPISRKGQIDEVLIGVRSKENMFELTESIFFDNRQINVVKEMIRQMHQLGFLCSRSFFVNMAGEKVKDVIACLIELSEKLKVHTVAEGIETDEMVEYLRMIKCDMMQG